MPKDAQGKNRKYKHHQEKEFHELTLEEIQAAESAAKEETANEDEPSTESNLNSSKVKPTINNEQEDKWARKKVPPKQQRNYDIPPPDDSD